MKIIIQFVVCVFLCIRAYDQIQFHLANLLFSKIDLVNGTCKNRDPMLYILWFEQIESPHYCHIEAFI
jgi:hypothetical protein